MSQDLFFFFDLANTLLVCTAGSILGMEREIFPVYLGIAHFKHNVLVRTQMHKILYVFRESCLCYRPGFWAWR